MPVTRDKRLAILDHLADHVLAVGLSASSLRALAAAAKTSDRMLLYYFSDKAALIEATLDHVVRRLDAILASVAPAPVAPATLLADMFAMARTDAFWPYFRLWLEIAGLAAKGDATCRKAGERIARGYLAWCAARIDSPAATRDRDAAVLLVTLEGMVLLHSVGLGDVCEHMLTP